MQTSTPLPPLPSQPLAPVKANTTETSPAQREIMGFLPTRKPASTGRAKKSADKVDLHGIGPGMTDVGMEWEAFLEVIAEILEKEPAFLFINSMEWHWIKPANSMFLSLCSCLANISMMKKFKRSRLSQKTVSGSYIVIRMDEPVKKPVNRISH